MKVFSLAVLAVFLSGPAFAQTAEILPVNPTAADRLTLQLTSDILCPTIVPGGLRMEGQVITVEVTRSCYLAGRPFMGRVTIGRLPAGSYRINVVSRLPGSELQNSVASLELAVKPFPDLTYVTEDLTGLWLTDTPGEGVTIIQSGKKAFIVITTYDKAGNQRWLAIPDAKLDLQAMAADGPALLLGTMFETRGFPTTGLSRMIEIGTAQIVLPSFELDRLTMILVGDGQVRQVALRRFNF